MEEARMVVNDGERHELIDLPPGFRFHPTDEEIITCYLTEKVMNSNFTATAIGEADLNKCEPWDLPKKAKMGEKEWYFFCQRDRKYPTGMRTNRATESGYWKATGKDKEIFKGKSSSLLVGMKKTLVFYKGRAPKGEKTNWVMHEYRLQGKYYNLSKPSKDEWVVCRVFHKNMGLIKKTPIMNTQGQLLRIDSFGDHDHDLLDYSSLPPLMDIPTVTNNKPSGYGGDHQDLKPKPSNGLSSNYLNYLPTNSNYYNNSYQASLGNPMQTPSTMLYPHHQFPNHSFSFQPNPNFMFRSTTGRDDDEAILRTIAMAGAGNNNNNNNIETTSTAAAAAAAGGGFLTEMTQCKVEQFSCNNQSSMFSVSQDTGLSTDMNTNTTEISSSPVSKQENMGTNNNSSSSYDHQHLQDIQGLWDF